MSLFRTSLALVLALATVGCASRTVGKKPVDPATNAAVTKMWTAEIKRVARTGDWILTRSYSNTGDAIVAATPGEELSHSSIYDAESGTAIEAMRKGVREVPLENLIARNRLVMIVRPRGLTEAQRRASLVRARSAIGKKYDYTGVFGADSESRFYCTELVVWASGFDKPRIITPASLLEYGPVIYYSGKRDDLALQDIAHRRSSRDRAADR